VRWRKLAPNWERRGRFTRKKEGKILPWSHRKKRGGVRVRVREEKNSFPAGLREREWRFRRGARARGGSQPGSQKELGFRGGGTTICDRRDPR